MIKNIIYLHGFASSPGSSKAKYITDFFGNINIKTYIPDLNCGDFTTVTISKMLSVIRDTVSRVEDRFIIVGSSMGGYLATLYVENTEEKKLPDKMLLLAPGFNLYNLFREWLGDFGIAEWEKNGYFSFMHYAYNRELPLSYEFYKDLRDYPAFPHIRHIPAHIIHGTEDNVVPVSVTKEFLLKNPHARAEFVKETHELFSSKELILTRIQEMLY